MSLKVIIQSSLFTLEVRLLLTGGIVKEVTIYKYSSAISFV